MLVHVYPVAADAQVGNAGGGITTTGEPPQVPPHTAIGTGNLATAPLTTSIPERKIAATANAVTKLFTNFLFIESPKFLCKTVVGD